MTGGTVNVRGLRFGNAERFAIGDFAGTWQLNLPTFKNLYFSDEIAARDSIDDLHPAQDLPEDSVPAVQMRLRRMSDEELAATGVFARQRHADRPARIRSSVHLAADLITRTAFA